MKIVRYIVILLLLFVGVNALIAGYLLIADPSGARLGMSINQIRPGYFDDFLIPGLVLFGLNGVLCVLTAITTLLQWQHYSKLVTLQGTILLIWIAVQVFLFGDIYAPQYLIGGIAVVLLVVGAWLWRRSLPRP